MATNCYYLTELIYFGSEPAHYYGYYVTTSSDSVGFSFFGTNEARLLFEHGVQIILDHCPPDSPPEVKHGDPKRIGALLAGTLFAGHDDDKEFCQHLLNEELAGVSPQLESDLGEVVEACANGKNPAVTAEHNCRTGGK
jgi:hypothetical protein